LQAVKTNETEGLQGSLTKKLKEGNYEKEEYGFQEADEKTCGFAPQEQEIAGAAKPPSGTGSDKRLLRRKPPRNQVGKDRFQQAHPDRMGSFRK
jgi:hypothetical protein